MKQDSKQLLFLSIVSFFAQLFIASVNLSLVYYLNDVMHYKASLIAITVSSLSVSYVVFCILLEKPTKKISPRNNIFISLLMMGVFILFFINTQKYIFILINLILYGGFTAFLWPHMASWFSRGREDANLNRAISFFNLSWGFGSAFSSILCGVLTEINVVLPLIVSILSFFILSIIVKIMTSKLPYLKAVESEEHYNQNSNLVDQSTPLRYYSWIAVFMTYFFFGMFTNIFPLYAKNDLLINETRIGILLWSKGIISCIAFFYLGKMKFWHFKSSYIFGCKIALAILCFITAFCHSYYSFFLCFMIFGFIYSMMYIQSIFHGASGAINRTKRMTIHEVSLSLGLILGSIVSGTIYDKFGFNNALISLGFIFLVITFIELVVYFINKQKQTEKIYNI